jgi:uncharacterized membrane protein
MVKDDIPEIPFSGVIYGEIIYWGTLLGSVITVVGSVIAFLIAQNNVMDPSYVFGAIWEGKTNAQIWKGGIGAIPNGHWYLPGLPKGDALTMFGLALGVFTVIPGMFASAIVLMKRKQFLYGILAAIGGAIVTVSMLGLITMPS